MHSLDSAISIIDAELEWCIEHPEDALSLSLEYRKGFSAGLKQAKYLITKSMELQMDEDETGMQVGEEFAAVLDASWDLYKKLSDLRKYGRLWAIAATEAEKLQAWIAYAMTTVDDDTEIAA